MSPSLPDLNSVYAPLIPKKDFGYTGSELQIAYSFSKVGTRMNLASVSAALLVLVPKSDPLDVIQYPNLFTHH